MKSNRSMRVNSEYQREISALISGELKHREPELKGIVSVTEADVAPDLKTAKIYLSVYASTKEESKKSFEIVRANAAFLRHELSKVMRMRTVPTLTFLPDSSMEYGSKMDEIFAKLHRNEEKD